MKIAYYTPQKLKPPVRDIIKAVETDYPEVDEFVEWRRGMDPTIPLIGLGELPDERPLLAIKGPSQNQLLALANALTDLHAAIALITKPQKLREFSYTVWNVKNPHDLEKTYKGSNVFLVDIETGGDIKTMLPEETWLLSVSIYDGKKLVVLSEEWLADSHNRSMLGTFLTKKDRKLIAHNMKFDFRTLTAQLKKKIYGHLDTMLLHHAMYPAAREHGLKALCRKYLGAPDWDAATKKYVKGYYKDVGKMPEEYFYPSDIWYKYFDKLGKVAVGFEAIPREVLYEYNAYDVYYNWHLYEYLINLADERVTRVALHEYRMGNLFQDIESWGIEVDLDHLDGLAESFEEEKAEYMAKLAELIDPGFNPNSPKQVMEVFESVDIHLKSTDEKTLLALKDNGVHPKVEEFIDTLLDVRGVNKMLGTYTSGIKTRMHGTRVFPTYKVHGTSTGRLSSSDPNIQNIPRDKRLRNLFTVPDKEGYDFIETDYSQAELRVMAVLSKDKYLISLFQPDMPDFFDSLLPVAFPHDNISNWSKQERKDNRAKLKSVIYGLSYGRKARAIATELKMPVQEAQSIINNYFSAAPEFYEWRKDIELRALDPNGTLETVFGRRFQAEIITGRNKTNVINSALAFIPQSTASDICVTAAMEVHKWIGDYGGARIVTSVHDAINSEAQKKYTREIAERTQQEMEDAARRVFGDVVPFAAEADWGPSWGNTVSPEE